MPTRRAVTIALATVPVTGVATGWGAESLQSRLARIKQALSELDEEQAAYVLERFASDIEFLKEEAGVVMTDVPDTTDLSLAGRIETARRRRTATDMAVFAELARRVPRHVIEAVGAACRDNSAEPIIRLAEPWRNRLLKAWQVHGRRRSRHRCFQTTRRLMPTSHHVKATTLVQMNPQTAPIAVATEPEAPVPPTAPSKTEVYLERGLPHAARRATLCALREDPVPATPHMFAVIREHGYGKEQCVSLAFISALVLDPQESPRRYYLLPPEDEPAPAPEPPALRKPGARPRCGNREVVELE